LCRCVTVLRCDGVALMQCCRDVLQRSIADRATVTSRCAGRAMQRRTVACLRIVLSITCELRRVLPRLCPPRRAHLAPAPVPASGGNDGRSQGSIPLAYVCQSLLALHLLSNTHLLFFSSFVPFLSRDAHDRAVRAQHTLKAEFDAGTFTGQRNAMLREAILCCI